MNLKVERQEQTNLTSMHSIFGMLSRSSPQIHNTFGTYVPYSQAFEDSRRNEGKSLKDETFNFRARRIRKSQYEYANLFGKLNVIIGQLQEKYPLVDRRPTHVEEDVASVGTEPSSGASTSSETRTASSCTMSSHKRRTCLEDDFIELDEYEQHGQRKPLMQQNQYSMSKSQIIRNARQHHRQISGYPKRIEADPPFIVLGPNGTQIPVSRFDTVVWSSAAAATRSLLSIIFSNDVLATHTLTGKPSPAFHGRERPPKLQLDPYIVSDIINCVQAVCEGSEREIRAAITTKCADTAKKFKRRSLKAAANSR